MKKLIKNPVLLGIFLVCLFALFPKTEARAGLSLTQLQQKFPNGAYWNHIAQNGHGYSNYEDYGPCNNPDGYTWLPCDTHEGNAGVGGRDCNSFDNAYQCAGFAKKLAYDAYGSYCRNWGQTSIDYIKPGDVLHYTGGNADATFGHWVFVTGVNGNAITVGECNVGYDRCKIRWGNVIYKNNIQVKTLYSAPWTLEIGTVPDITAQTPKVSVDSSGLMTVQFSAVSNATYYDIVLFDANKYEIDYKNIGNNTTGTMQLPQAGVYYVKIYAYGTGGRTMSQAAQVSWSTIKTGWNQDNVGWWYRRSDGSYPYNQWEQIGGNWYYFNASGYRVTGWLLSRGTWYYLNADGKMQTGWATIGNELYYFNDSGAMFTGWGQTSDGTWYYFKSSGAAARGWEYIGGVWYAFDENCEMITGWAYDGDLLYYMEESGAMVSNMWLYTVDNEWYYMTSSGAAAIGWAFIDGTWYYFDSEYEMVTGWQVIGGKWYYFHGSGAMAANQWVGNYYLQSDGSMATNKWIGNYYVGADGCWIP